MKRIGFLFEQVYDWKNLWHAALKARQGKRFRHNVADFEFRREWELLRLQQDLQSERYRPGPYRSFRVFEPKLRLISAAPYRDRLVHHAICNVIEPIWEPVFVSDSYACRKGKGSTAAMRRAHHYARTFRYVLQCDVQRFFPSVDHDILKTRLQSKLKDRRLLNLLTTIIDHPFPGQSHANHFKGDDLFTRIERRCGLPIGNQTSQFFGNVMLNPLDHFVREELHCRGYVRYADDFLIFGNDKALLIGLRKQIAEFLRQDRLRIHPHKSVIFPVRCGIPFLGYRVFPTHIRLARKHIVRLRARLREMQHDHATGAASLTEIKQSLQSWWGYAMHANSKTIVQTILADFPFLQSESSG